MTGALHQTLSVQREHCKNNIATVVVYLFFAARACCAAAFIVYFPVAIWVRLHPTSTVPGLGLPISWLAFLGRCPLLGFGSAGSVALGSSPAALGGVCQLSPAGGTLVLGGLHAPARGWPIEADAVPIEAPR